MGGADDANPMNRSLPAEVVSRRRKVEKKAPPEEPPLPLDQRVVLAMRPEQRLKWLSLALQRLQQGKVQSSSIYDIVVHVKFPKDAAEKVGLKMHRAICAHISFFSQKQQRFMESESKLAQLFKDKAKASKATEGSGASSGGRDGTDVQALMERLLTLTAAEGQQFMDTLDAATKDKLEELLEERISARTSGNAPRAVADKGRGADGEKKRGDGSSRSRSASRSRSRSRSRGERRRRSQRRHGSRSRGWARSRSRS